MAQQIQCVCGMAFKVPDKFAGRKIRCLQCKQVMKLKPGNFDSGPGERSGAGYRCRGCSTEYGAGTKICLRCGINLETGALVYSPNEESSEETYDWSSEEAFLNRRGMLNRLFDSLGG